jgi:multimeric flavodoxin WrbA
LKKIFGFIGSPLKNKSNTLTLTRLMLDQLTRKDNGITHEILTAGDIKLNYCQACWTCMNHGHHLCPQDKLDDMPILKDKMQEADFIIFGSPVHTGHISGQMKTFLDRLSAWYHILMLAGKPGLTVVTTGSNHRKEVHDFLNMLMGCLGVKVVARLDAVGFSPGVLMNYDEAKRKAAQAAETVFAYVTGEKRIDSDAHMEKCFHFIKDKVSSGAKWLAGYDYWKNEGMLGLDSYAALLEKRRSEVSEEY